MKARMLFLLITALLLPHKTVVGFGDVDAALKSRLQSKLDSLYAGGSFPGVVVGITLADGTNFGLASGFVDKARSMKLKPDDILMQGSVGKTYVSAVALQLVKEGKIRLDDKIEKYLAKELWFSRLPNGNEVTVRMLMNHTSGLVRYEFKEE